METTLSSIPMTSTQESLRSFADKRLHARFLLAVPAKFLGHDATPIPIKTVDISIGGMGILAQEPMSPGTNCIIAFDSPLDDEGKRINVWAKVAYCRIRGKDEFQVGVYFRDFDSYSKFLIEKFCASQTSGLDNPTMRATN